MDIQGGSVVWILDADTGQFSKALMSAEQQARETGDEIDRSLGGAANQTSEAMRDLGRSVKQLGFGLFTTGAGLASTALTNMAFKGVQAADFIETTQIAMSGLTGSIEEGNKAMSIANNFWENNPFNRMDVVPAVKSLIQFGRTTQELQGDLELLGNVSLATGTNIQELALYYARTAGAGRAMTRDLDMMALRGLPIYAKLTEVISEGDDALAGAARSSLGLAKGADVTIGAIRELASDGAISFELFEAAMRKSVDPEIMELFEQTFSRQVDRLRGSFTILQGEMGGYRFEAGKLVIEQDGLTRATTRLAEAFADGLRSDEMRESIRRLGMSLAPVIDGLASAMPKILDAFGKALEFVSNNTKLLIPILGGALVMFGQLGRGIPGVGQVLYNVTDGTRKLAGAMKRLFMANPLLAVFITIFVAGLINAYKSSEEFREAVSRLFRALGDLFSQLMPVFTNFFDLFTNVASSGAFTKLLTGIVNVLAFFIELLAKIPPGVFTAILGGVLAFKAVKTVIGPAKTAIGLVNTLSKTTLGATLKSWAIISARAVVHATKASLAWIKAAGRVLIAWTVNMVKIAVQWAIASAKAVANALIAGATWVAQAVRAGIAWTVQMGVIIAKQVWAGFQSQAPALAAGIVWVVNAIKAGIAWTIQMAKIVGQMALTAARSAVHAVVAAATWIGQAVAIAVAWAVNLARVVATTLAQSAVSAGHGIAAAVTWLAQPVLIALAWAKQLALVIASQVAHVAKSSAQALLASGPWIAQALAVSTAWILNFLKMIPFMLGAALGFVANAVMVGLAWVASALMAAAAWIAANIVILGVIGIIIAVVAGAVYLIVKYWDEILEAAIKAWEWIQEVVSNFVEWVKASWPILLEVLTSPIRAAANAIVGHWERIRSGASSAFNWVRDTVISVATSIRERFISAKENIIKAFDEVTTWFKGLKDKVLRAIGNAKKWLLQIGKDIIDGLLDGIASKYESVKSKLKELTDLIPDWKGPASVDKKLLTENGSLLIDGLVSGIESEFGHVKSTMHKSGENASQGFIDGVGSKSSFNAGGNLSGQFLQGLKSEGGERSPWKTTKESGRYALEGFIEGIYSAENGLMSAASDVVDSVLGVFNKESQFSLSGDYNANIRRGVVTTYELGPMTGNMAGSQPTEVNNTYNITLPNVENANDFAREFKRAMVGRE